MERARPAFEKIKTILKDNPAGLTAREIALCRGDEIKANAMSSTRKVLGMMEDICLIQRSKLQFGNGYLYTIKQSTIDAMPSIHTAGPRGISKMQGIYTCPELKTNPYRPGSGDAYKIPSLYMGQRIARV